MSVDKEYVFICGLHRSGTSILNRIIQTHPLLTGFSGTGASEDEGQHLQTVIPHDGEFGGPGKFCFDDRARLTEDDLPRYRAGIPRILKAWERHWDSTCSMRVEKSPPNLIRSRFLQAGFPKSRFIFIIRHPLVVSMATQKWCNVSLEELIMHWIAGHRILLEDLPHLKHSFLVRYEDIAHAPDEVFADIWRFVGVRAQSIPIDMFENRNEQYLQSFESLIPPNIEQVSQDSSEIMQSFSYLLDAPYVRNVGNWTF